jgi:predicted DCC family thiol-disulfide oxidoreductase YuxK
MLDTRIKRFYLIVLLFLVIKVITVIILILFDSYVDLRSFLVWGVLLFSLLFSWKNRGLIATIFTMLALFVTIILNLSRSAHYSLLVLCFSITVISLVMNLSDKQFMDLLAFVFFLMYLFAALNKLNLGFMSGFLILNTSILLSQMATNFHTLFSLSLVFVSLSVILYEISLSIAVITKKVSTFFLVSGTAFHIAIILLMSGETLAITVDLLIYNLFCLIVLNKLYRRNWTTLFSVVWDAECSFCKTTITFLEKCDLWKRIEFVPNDNASRMKELGVLPEQSLKAIQVVDRETGVVYQGFAGFRCLSLVLPLFTILFPLLKFRPVEVLGQRVYALVAARRSCRN